MNDFEFLWLRFNDLTRPPPVAAPIRPPDTLLALFNVGGEDGASSVGVGVFLRNLEKNDENADCLRFGGGSDVLILSTYDPCTPVACITLSLMYTDVVFVR